MNKKKSHSLIDKSVLKQVFGKDDISKQEYLKSFIELTAERLTDANLAVKARDKTLVIKHLHQLKGPIGTIGFVKMYKLCEKLEEELEHSDWSHADKTFSDLEKLLKKLEKELTEA